jgi:putative FmdB family regulatory protein
MPIYEYRRPDGSTFELMQSFADDALTKDPETGVPVQRVLHAPAIHFKGKGFHNTDYGTRRRNREMEKSASDGADKNDAKMAEKKSDSKSESTSSETKPSGDSKPKGDGSKDKKKAA